MKYLFTALFLVFLADASFSQTVIYSSNYTALVGQHLTVSSFNDTLDRNLIPSLVAKSGSGQTWDLSTYKFYASSSGDYFLEAGTAGLPSGGDPSFNSATHTLITSGKFGGKIYTVYNLFIVTPDSVNAIGSGFADSTGTKFSFASVNTPPLKTYVFPLKLGANWTSTTSSTSFGGAQVTTIFDSVDAEGTLIIPGKTTKGNDEITSSVQALRIKQVKMTSGNYYDTAVSYSFIEASAKINATITPAKVSLPPNPGSISYSVAASGSSGVNENQNSDFTSDQNYPNPFSSITNIHFTLNSESPVRCSIYDVLGRKLQAINLGVMPAGDHGFMIDGSKLPAGNYYYTIEANGNSLTKQMVVLH